MLVQRVTSFGRYFIGGLHKWPEVEKLFASEKFQSDAKKICPPERQVLDPFQFNIIIQIPGQSVATHIDAPYFWGASRMDIPQWLLVVMVFSNLFKDKFIDQVQVVGYLHNHQDEKKKNTTKVVDEKDEGGEFIYYQKNDNGRYSMAPAVYRAGSAVDGSKLLHASRVYRPSSQVPSLDKDKDSALVYKGNELWDVTVDNDTVASYSSDDLRISIVYRARCFESQEELKRYSDFPESERMSLDFILNALLDDLLSSGKISKPERAVLFAPQGRLKLAMLLMDTYIKYPLPSIDSQPFMPFNYCALSRLFPSIKMAMDYIC